MVKDKNKNYLIYLLLSTAILISSNIISVKEINIWGIILPASVTVFPLVYLILTAVTKIHGKEKASELILLSIFGNLIVSFIVAVALDIPSASSTNINIALNTILDANIVTTILSVLTYFIAGISNIQLIDKLNSKVNLISLIIIASATAIIVDVVIFNTLQAILNQSFNTFVNSIFNKGIVQLIYTIILSPLFYYFIKENNSENSLEKNKEIKKANK